MRIEKSSRRIGIGKISLSVMEIVCEYADCALTVSNDRLGPEADGRVLGAELEHRTLPRSTSSAVSNPLLPFFRGGLSTCSPPCT